MIEGTQVVKQLTGFGSDEAYGKTFAAVVCTMITIETFRSSFQMPHFYLPV